MNSELEIALYLTDDATEAQIHLWFLWHLLPDNYTLRFNADIITLSAGRGALRDRRNLPQIEARLMSQTQNW